MVSAAVLGTLLIAPSAGNAATNFGSRLLNDPTTADCTLLLTNCTVVSFIQPSAPAGDPYSGGAPVSGVITQLRVRAYGNGGPATVGFRVGNVTSIGPMSDSATASAGPIGATATVPAGPLSPTPVTNVVGRIPVVAGQHLAVDGSVNLVATYNSSGDKFSYVFAPTLVAGQAARGSNAVTGELLVAATIEPDADKDGYGDETQDRCPSDGATHGVCVTGLKVSKRKITYRLSGAAKVRLALGKASKGRRVKGECVRQTSKNRSAKRCTYYKKFGKSFSGSGKAGSNKAKLRKLRRGKYQLTLTATDSAGNKTVKTKKFSVRK
jgi:hypothetical protein